MKIKNRLQAPKLLTVPPMIVMTLFAAVHLSASGTKRTYRAAPHMSAFGGKADIVIALRNVRF
jgi:hypothetical protein